LKQYKNILMNYLRALKRTAGERSNVKYATEETPLRSELLSATQMGQYGKFLAKSHTLSKQENKDKLLPRLAENEAIISDIFSLLAAATKEKSQITRAAEWLLDNYYLIEEQIRIARKHLPKGYSRELPRLAGGPSAGYPRVYDLALEIVSHGDGKVEMASMCHFVSSYQEASTLALGELWAVPIMLRLALIENLRRVATRLAATRANHALAETWVDRLMDVAERDPSNLILEVADLARSNPPMDSSFVAELTRRLQSQNTMLSLPLTWISQRLSESGMTIEQLIVEETQQQAADQVSLSNSIGSLRFLGTMDWREFVESMSVVERSLRSDPLDVYRQMDFASRDNYRHVIEKIAKRSPMSEAEVADRAVQFAREKSVSSNADDPAAHVGYYLIDKGLPELEVATSMRRKPLEAIKRWNICTPFFAYLGGILLFTAIFTGILLHEANPAGARSWAFALIVIGILIAASQLASSIVNWLATLVAKPHQLPRMDFSKAIPSDCRTLTVVPSILSSPDAVEELCDALEVRYLANRDPNLLFCLLSDFTDADTETTPEDEPLLEQARRHIEELNQKYAANSHSPFLLLHRPRRWNAEEKKWMGYERKRGKLEELNVFLRGGAKDRFSAIVGNTDGLADIRYVITLDSDTQLLRDTAKQFVGTMAHLLNRARSDAGKGIVDQGYGILQPRITYSLPGSNASAYERLGSGEAGIDPYTRTVSDVYQDVFRQGSFIGKGIYDVDAVQSALHGKIPENRILSHDLLEGCYARSGLLSDAQLYEKHPSRYETDIMRRHRWIRGDWQLLPWLMPVVPCAATCDGKKHASNPLSGLSRWKLFDNLRRSLVAPSIVLLFVWGWLSMASPWRWTGALLAVILIQPLLASLTDLLRKPQENLPAQHLSAVMQSASSHFSNALLNLAFLPYEAYFSLDAILRTLWRMFVSHQNLLEWNTYSEPDHEVKAEFAAYLRLMWFAPTLALAVAVALFAVNRSALPVALIFLLLWLVSPAVAWLISVPSVRKEEALSDEQTVFLRKLARRIWAFFETYVGPEDNWLPPDNVQDIPSYCLIDEYSASPDNIQTELACVVAHRTSPTNIGLSLLANLTAYDFGYIPAGIFMKRTQKTFDTMEMLERHQGHFYNWYDTQTLKPLQNPVYVSSVDSGNLVGHLLTLCPGLQSMPDQPVFSDRLIEGIRDTFMLIRETSGKSGGPRLDEFEKKLDAAMLQVPLGLRTAHGLLEQFASDANGLTASSFSGDSEPAGWALALAKQCRDAMDELKALAPWASLPSIPEPLLSVHGIDTICTWRELAALEHEVGPAIEKLHSDGSQEDKALLEELTRLVAQGSLHAREELSLAERLALKAGEFGQMEFGFLFDQATNLLSIGYNMSERRLDASYYDLLASEARLCSFVGIAQGQLPQENWFALGRNLTVAGRESVLLSWSGSMFEYLMPSLVMPNYENTLLDHTFKAAVKKQIDYGAQRGVPWGISESGYYAFDARLNYQYRAFGVPGLGLKRGLGDDLVIAPYASMLALMILPREACDNLIRMKKEGFSGTYGLYEAIDYTPSRLPRGQTNAIVQSYMAHHQGMGLLSLLYRLRDRPMQKRFESNPWFKATIPLLHERVPKAAAVAAEAPTLAEIRTTSIPVEMPMRVLNSANTALPEVQLLSNGNYHVMITNSGGGYSLLKDIAITRWKEDATRDNWGTFFYLRDMETGTFWSTSYQPVRSQPENYEVIFSEGRAEFRSLDHEIETHTDIVVSPEDDIELRRNRIINRSAHTRTIEITSYSEIVLAPRNADAAHPAFSKLFVQTEVAREQRAILATRRPRSVDEKPPYLFHMLVAHDAGNAEISFETDRMKFIGRGNDTSAPQAMLARSDLSGSDGSVLDPIAAIRYRITLQPDQDATIDYVCGVAESREACLRLIDKYDDRSLADRVFEMAWTHGQAVLRQLNASESDAQLYAKLASSLLFANSQHRAEKGVLIKNNRGQSGLWSHAISGDLPIVLLQIQSQESIDLARQIVQAHAYWYMKGLTVDLVIWNEDHASYRQMLQEQLIGLVASSTIANALNRSGGIFVRQAEQISNEDRVLISTVARIIISDSEGPLAIQINRGQQKERRLIPLLSPTRAYVPLIPAAEQRADLLLFNGTGGFSPDGKEYVIITTQNKQTPVPWVNVLANQQFGCVITENGQSYTWHENAHEFRLTPWHNDPVTDAGGEAFYLRDEESGHFWSPSPLPCRGSGSYTSRHGFGYSIFEHDEDGIQSELKVYVAPDSAIKYSVLKVRNQSGSARTLSATGYVEWVLGDLREKSLMYVITEVDPVSGAIFARNAYNTEFSDRIAFFAVDAPTKTVSGNRTEFIGRNGTMQNPAAMKRTRLSDRVGAGLDPCAAIMVPFRLADGQEREIIFMLGTAGRRSADASQFVHRFRNPDAADDTLQQVRQYWQRTLGAVEVETPDISLNMLANGWLMYQTIACRMWGRSGYYQSGGAFGFRDQLQDSMAVIHTQPQLTRETLLRFAAHQFQEGDVQHWWHPPSGRGVRTKCSDDYLWLPLATCRYVLGTHDTGVLDEKVNLLEGRPLHAEEDSYYDLPARSSLSETLYQHCTRAILHGLRFGVHGLPLIGSMDWNDGMDKVGDKGQGESVWLGFFLYEVLTRFSELADLHGDPGFAERCRKESAELRQRLNDNAWDGSWYRRAYFDDGTPLGSASNQECQIDSISQSWAVLSKAGDEERSRMAMNALDQRLVRRDSGLIQLLDPPFDKSDLNPGYIKGYLPGVRENGGQYTHAAVWAVMAFAQMGDCRRAWELFRLINPVNHALTPAQVDVYKVEPYVVAADVYAVAPHTGRGGWTWYTGSSGWMYRLIIESLLGLALDGNRLTVAPCFPVDWESFKLRYRYRETGYDITVIRSEVHRIVVDGTEVEGNAITMTDDHRQHSVEISVRPVAPQATVPDK